MHGGKSSVFENLRLLAPNECAKRKRSASGNNVINPMRRLSMKKKKIYNIGWKSVIACYVTGFIVFGLLAFLVNLFTNYPKFSNETGLLRTCIQLAITAILLISHALYTFFADRSVMETPRKMWATMTAMLICYAVIEFASFWTYGLYAVPIALCAVMLSLLISDKCGFYANFVVIMLCFLQYINWQDVSTLDSEAYFYLLFGGVIQAVFASYIFGKGYRRINYVGYGLLLGVIAAVCSFAAYLMFIDGTTISWAEIGIKAGISFASGIICTMLMFVLVSLFEVSFDLVTVFRFSEIASSDNELMRRLFEKAPGTYNHCLTVAVYAEACAMAIGISVVEARAAAYYHDIGKLKNPSYFVENQFGGVNPHDNMTPEASVRMIKSHVTNGIALANEYKLPEEVKRAIAEHHGTMPIKYFYLKAKKYTDGDLPYDDYCYDGPKPTTKVSAILMICDASEAALRASGKQNAEKVVDDIVAERLAFNQFSDCDITMKEIDIIKSTIITTFCGIRHQRVSYPDIKLEGDK